ncbi:MAG TPA: hypothetical protein VN238_22330 [Solirubrobacteraceae bacterium]|nr:hypothetical protein [Solirubrobacteraceae bacterium]
MPRRALCTSIAVALLAASAGAASPVRAGEPISPPMTTVTAMAASEITDGPVGMAHDDRYVAVQLRVGTVRVVDTRDGTVTADVPTPDGRSCRPVAVRAPSVLVRCAPAGAVETFDRRDEHLLLSIATRTFTPIPGDGGSGALFLDALGARWIEGTDAVGTAWVDRRTGAVRRGRSWDHGGEVDRDLDDPALRRVPTRDEHVSSVRCGRRGECLELHIGNRARRLGRVTRGYSTYQPGRYVSWWNGASARAYDRRTDRSYVWRFPAPAPRGITVQHTAYGALFVRTTATEYPGSGTLLFSRWRR